MRVVCGSFSASALSAEAGCPCVFLLLGSESSLINLAMLSKNTSSPRFVYAGEESWSIHLSDISCLGPVFMVNTVITAIYPNNPWACVDNRVYPSCWGVWGWGGGGPNRLQAPVCDGGRGRRNSALFSCGHLQPV